MHILTDDEPYELIFDSTNKLVNCIEQSIDRFECILFRNIYAGILSENQSNELKLIHSTWMDTNFSGEHLSSVV